MKFFYIIIISISLQGCASNYGGYYGQQPQTSQVLNTVANVASTISCALDDCPFGRHNHFDQFGRNYRSVFFRQQPQRYVMVRVPARNGQQTNRYNTYSQNNNVTLMNSMRYTYDRQNDYYPVSRNGGKFIPQFDSGLVDFRSRRNIMREVARHYHRPYYFQNGHRHISGCNSRCVTYF